MATIHGYRSDVGIALTPDFCAGGPAPELNRYEEVIESPDGGEFDDIEIHLDLLDLLVEQIMEDPRWDRGEFLSDEDKNRLDGWFAPRLHAALRIPRRLASDRRFWTRLAVDVMNPYLVKRFTEPGKREVPKWRYTGILTRNGIARLWWGAELMRNGPSYDIVPAVFRRTRTAQFALELDYSRYRPAPIAFVRVAEALGGGTPLTDSRMLSLSKRVNALLTLHALESMGLDEMGEKCDADWFRHRPALAEISSEELPVGPEDGYASEEAIRSLEAWFRSLSTDGPVVRSA